MSKKRPSTRTSVKSRGIIDRFSEDYWHSRVFRNTYTHHGRRFVVGRWSIKIQIAGVRRTFSLESADQVSAAREALLLYRRLTNESSNPQGPPSAAETVAPGEKELPVRSTHSNSDRSLPAYWRPRLIRRKYLGRALGRADYEWSVLIEFKSERSYFPLATADESAAAAAAAERFSVIAALGWNHARLSYFREFTVGVVWSTNPFACTYTTLLAIPGTEPSEAPASADLATRKQPVIVLERDYGIRRALAHWLRRQQQTVTRVLCVEPSEAIEVIETNAGALTLVNMGTVGSAGELLIHELTAACPRAAIFGYGVFEDSDHIFASLSGVNGGYLLRRRPPEQLLEPVLGVSTRARADAPPLAQTARRYFERLFDFADSKEIQPDAGLLTGREYEILSCLSKGYQDKEIASRLNISIWTVHSHVRKIFVKYGVYSRTEAVVKYLRL